MDNKDIFLKQIVNINNLCDYKLHVAKWNGSTYPLHVFARDFNEWKGWNEWRGEGNKNRFTRKYIFSLIDFYPEKGVFLFGGIFEVLKTYSDHYDVRLMDEMKEYIGRMKIVGVNTNRGSAFNFENHYNEMQVFEILKEPFRTFVFPGYENIDYDFPMITDIIKKDTADWKSALSNMKGVYMIFDKSNGKKYIGSAYGERGIWSRWGEYVNNGHGGNKELAVLISEKGIEYAKENFKFTLLEIFPMFKADDCIIIRENYWKEVMMSRGRFGYNAN